MGCFVAFAASAAEPSAVRGALLYKPCEGCHGVQGVAVHPDAPNLAHQPPLAVTYQLIQFRDGRRTGGGMETMAQNLSDQDARDLSAYLAGLPAPVGRAVSDQVLRRGESIANALYCNSCHGEQLEGQKHVPRLAGQKQSYLERQLNHFKSGERIDMDGSMENAALGLDPDSIRAVSAFAASR